MRNFPEHPEIECCLRTGYPRGVDLDVEEDDAEGEYLDGYSNEDTIYEARREEELE